ncbi:MAG: SCO family protein [Candidatus Zixiibacteriota bacterium]
MTYFVVPVAAQEIRENDPQLRNIDIVERPGDSIPMDVVLFNDDGKQTTIGEYFDGEKPVILIMAYYSCPMLCNLVLNGVADGGKQLDWIPGDQYRIMTVSIDPTEGFSLARAKKENYITSMGMPAAAEGWTFFTGDSTESRRLADAVGFKYYYDEEKEQYAHAACIFVLTPDGKISRYLYGIEFKPRDLKLALLEASEGRIGNTFDRILLYCYHYDPAAGGYVVLATNIMKLGGVVTLVILGGLLGLFWLREWRKRKLRQGESTA